MPAISARMRSASPRWLPSKRRGRCTLRIQNAVATPTSTSTAKRSTRSAYQPCSRASASGDPSGSHGSRSTIADGRHEDRREEDEEAPEDERVHEPGPEALEELPLPEDDRRLVADARGQIANALTRLARPDEPREEERAPREQRAGDRDRDDERDRGGDARRRAQPLPLAFLSSAEIAGHDLVQVADDGVVGAREDRRLRVGVDREDRLRALAAGHVLRRARDAARDVDVRRDLRPGLADLVRVRAPAGHRHRARAADGAAEQAGELLDDPEPFRRARAAPARDDDLRLGERDAAGARRRRARARARRGRRRRERGREALDREPARRWPARRRPRAAARS